MPYASTAPVRQEFYGADWFFYGDTFSGCVSRAHVNKVFNVGNGGCEVPTIVLDDTVQENWILQDTETRE
jgi:hypothetical protein